MDFAGQRYAHVIARNNISGIVLTTIDFLNPDAPVKASALTIPNSGWSAAARFDADRLYLAPDQNYSNADGTPIQIYDLTLPSAPALKSSTTVPGMIWNSVPAGNRVFALGADYNDSSSIALRYLDVGPPPRPMY